MGKWARGLMLLLIAYIISRGVFDASLARAEGEASLEGKAVPRIEFTRMLSSAHVKKGSEVTITYRVRNAGDLPVYGLSLEDELCGAIDEIETLMPGERKSFVKKVQIDKTSVSRPTVTYRAEGAEEDVVDQLKAATIYLADEQLDRLLAADKTSVAPGELVTLRLSLANKGNVAYENLRISDAALGEIGVIPGALKPGEEYTFVKTVTLKSTTTFQFEIAGKGSSGSEIVENSNMLTIAVSPAIENISVKVDAIAMPSYLPGPGETTFVIAITNEGDADIRNAVLLERNLGELKNLAVLAPGTTTIEYRLNVSSKDSYVFAVELTDAYDGHMTVFSPPVEVDVDAKGAQHLLEADPPTEDETSFTQIAGISRQLDPSKYYEQMLLWAVLVISVLVLCLLYFFTRRGGPKRRRKRRRRGKTGAKYGDNSDNPEFADTLVHPVLDVSARDKSIDGG